MIIALDIGKKRTGIAKAVDGLNIAIGIKTVFSFKELIYELKLLKFEKLIVGWPLTLKGEEGHQCLRIKSTANNILHEIGKDIELIFIDERFTSCFEHNVKEKDTASAVVILQKYLDKTK